MDSEALFQPRITIAETLSCPTDQGIELHQFANQLAINELQSPLSLADVTDTNHVDDMIQRYNLREFNRFELLLPIAHGAHEKVRQYANVRERSDAELEGAIGDDRARCLYKIKSGIKDDLKSYASKVRHMNNLCLVD
ncbi:uncharacterized protein MAM_05498 [Metarhizium album ARSEF 1941]|uniref:Uncharacterized protein n=1 Tax=Metarhizium album (strain ARSEF 1941) TaxID=1081103 RepID=A0A0B2WUE6_METAS|nr:uncharacterized protein MAM_05498 [Metarhizium album ARSEF 1941]KHN96555.1 hypothetical protein MAM_05498 [Metarhizium album ARSEF 1941]